MRGVRKVLELRFEFLLVNVELQNFNASSLALFPTLWHIFQYFCMIILITEK